MEVVALILRSSKYISIDIIVVGKGGRGRGEEKVVSGGGISQIGGVDCCDYWGSIFIYIYILDIDIYKSIENQY